MFKGQKFHRANRAPQQPQLSGQFLCVLSAERLSATLADLRDKGKTELELSVVLNGVGGPMATRDVVTWIISQLYTTLRYVQPQQVPPRMRELCLARFK